MTRKYYDSQAEKEFTKLELKYVNWRDSERIKATRRDQLKLFKPLVFSEKVILDVGCGPGNWSVVLGKNNFVIGVDISPEAIGIAREQAKGEDADFSGIVADINEIIPLKNETIDICFCAFALHHLPDIDRVLNELYRTLKYKGYIAIMDPNGSSPYLRIREFFMGGVAKQLLIRYGLRSPNESLHKPVYYFKKLKNIGYRGIRIYFYNDRQPPWLTDIKGLKNLVWRMFYIISLLTWQINKLLTNYRNSFSPNVVIIAQKQYGNNMH